MRHPGQLATIAYVNGLSLSTATNRGDFPRFKGRSIDAPIPVVARWTEELKR